MKAMNGILAVLIVSVMGGCTTVKMYDSASLSREESSIFHSNGASYGPYMTWEIDGKKKLGGSLISPKAAFLSPGEHDISLSVMLHKGMIPPGERLADGASVPGGFVVLRGYSFKADFKSGYSYQIEHPGWKISDQKFELCLFGEPHDAEGSEVSWGHEHRKMSETAEKIICKSPDFIRTSEGVTQDPVGLPDYLIYSDG